MDAPAPTPPTPAPVGSPLQTPRSAQLALGVFLLITVALLALRGYGNGFGMRPTAQASPAAVDLNQADRTTLEQVPGIGPSLAKEIAADRDRHGPFKSVEELSRVKGVGPKTLEKVRPFFHVQPTAVSPATTPPPEPLVLERKPAPAPFPRTAGSSKKFQQGDPPIDVNAATLEELQRLPGVGPITAQNIVAARSEKPFNSIEELDRVKGIGPKTMEKIRPFAVVK